MSVLLLLCAFIINKIRNVSYNRDFNLLIEIVMYFYVVIEFIMHFGIYYIVLSFSKNYKWESRSRRGSCLFKIAFILPLITLPLWNVNQVLYCFCFIPPSDLGDWISTDLSLFTLTLLFSLNFLLFYNFHYLIIH